MAFWRANTRRLVQLSDDQRNLSARQLGGAVNLVSPFVRRVAIRSFSFHPPEVAVFRSVLDAIKVGQWDFEPEQIRVERFSRTDALPGTREKLCVLAERARLGLPLWHPSDRENCEGLYGDAEEE